MKLKTSIRTRMIVGILLTSLVTFSLSVYYCASRTKKMVKNRAKTIVMMNGENNADAIAAKISNYYTTIKAVASMYANYYDTDEDQRRIITNENNRKVLQQNPDLVKMNDNWNIEESDFKEVSGPTLEKLQNKNANAYLCRLATPIKYEGSFVGEVSASIIVDSLLNGFEYAFGDTLNEKIYIVTGQGVVAYSNNSSDRGKQLSDVLSAYYREYGIEKYVKEHQPYIDECKISGSEPNVICISPIRLSENKQWTLCVLIPKLSVLGDAKNITLTTILLMIVCFVILGTITLLITNKISKSLKTINAALIDVSDGDIKNDNVLAETTLTDINNINESLKSVISGLIKAAEFSEQIGRGNLDSEFTALSENDKLGNALINMRNDLRQNEEENAKRKIEDEKVNWATLGLAKFAEILHTDNQSINDLSYEILRNLIKYIDVNQGAIYVLDDTGEEPVYEMTSAIAYDRRKFMQKRFAVGEDLVGRCAYEHKTIYMTDIPENYITITSGMGGATASALLLVPLVVEDKVFGIIELASFAKLEEYKINFVEKLAESIASTISTVKVNERTNELLKQSKVQAEELASQEEEMRQNMEELQATQEEAARRDNETNSIMKVINQQLVVVEYDTDGKITNANAAMSELMNMPVDSIIGQKADDGLDMSAEQRRAYTQMWNDLRRGISGSTTSHIIFNGVDIWLAETYTPITEPLETKPYKIVKIGVNITERMAAKNAMAELEKLSASKDATIAELEEKLSNSQNTAVKEPAKKTEKAAANQSTTDEAAEFNAEVGEQPLIEWTVDCESGIAEFDGQRQQLATLANTLYTAFRSAKSKKEMKESLRSLIDFASYHFGSVESYIDESGLAGKDSFKADFDNFIAKLELFQKLFVAGKVKTADSLMLYVSNWLKAYTEKIKGLSK
ncbi:MAG: GAF domain-containing protein [Salinivirgaceae bacterium]|nr:GAF domain-containing protein [Salinivirgaceae bacterium]